MPITYAKLNSGAWGARSTALVTPGQTIVVTKRDGSPKTETVDKIVWSGDGVWLVALRRAGDADAAQRPKSKPRARGRAGKRTGCSCGSREDANGSLIDSPNNCKQCCFDDE
jgi:hypothetical protein